VIEWSNLQKEAFQLDHRGHLDPFHIVEYYANQQFLNDQSQDE
jgi:hypothetical protein